MRQSLCAGCLMAGMLLSLGLGCGTPSAADASKPSASATAEINLGAALAQADTPRPEDQTAKGQPVNEPAAKDQAANEPANDQAPEAAPESPEPMTPDEIPPSELEQVLAGVRESLEQGQTDAALEQLTTARQMARGQTVDAYREQVQQTLNEEVQGLQDALLQRVQQQNHADELHGRLDEAEAQATDIVEPLLVGGRLHEVIRNARARMRDVVREGMGDDRLRPGLRTARLEEKFAALLKAAADARSFEWAAEQAQAQIRQAFSAIDRHALATAQGAAEEQIRERVQSEGFVERLLDPQAPLYSPALLADALRDARIQARSALQAGDVGDSLFRAADKCRSTIDEAFQASQLPEAAATVVTEARQRAAQDEGGEDWNSEFGERIAIIVRETREQLTEVLSETDQRGRFAEWKSEFESSVATITATADFENETRAMLEERLPKLTKLAQRVRSLNAQ